MEPPRARACFCLSKARDEGAHASEPAATRRLRAELQGLKLSELKRRAQAAGAPAAAIETVDDDADPKGAVIALVLEHECPDASGLAGLKPSALKKQRGSSGSQQAEVG